MSKIPPEQPTRVITVRMTPTQHQRLRDAALDARTSMNNYCLIKLFGEEPDEAPPLPEEKTP